MTVIAEAPSKALLDGSAMVLQPTTEGKMEMQRALAKERLQRRVLEAAAWAAGLDLPQKIVQAEEREARRLEVEVELLQTEVKSMRGYLEAIHDHVVDLEDDEEYHHQFPHSQAVLKFIADLSALHELLSAQCTWVRASQALEEQENTQLLEVLERGDGIDTAIITYIDARESDDSLLEPFPAPMVIPRPWDCHDLRRSLTLASDLSDSSDVSRHSDLRGSFALSDSGSYNGVADAVRGAKADVAHGHASNGYTHAQAANGQAHVKEPPRRPVKPHLTHTESLPAGHARVHGRHLHGSQNDAHHPHASAHAHSHGHGHGHGHGRGHGHGHGPGHHHGLFHSQSLNLFEKKPWRLKSSKDHHHAEPHVVVEDFKGRPVELSEELVRTIASVYSYHESRGAHTPPEQAGNEASYPGTPESTFGESASFTTSPSRSQSCSLETRRHSFGDTADLARDRRMAQIAGLAASKSGLGPLADHRLGAALAAGRRLADGVGHSGPLKPPLHSSGSGLLLPPRGKLGGAADVHGHHAAKSPLRDGWATARGEEGGAAAAGLFVRSLSQSSDRTEASGVSSAPWSEGDVYGEDDPELRELEEQRMSLEQERRPPHPGSAMLRAPTGAAHAHPAAAAASRPILAGGRLAHRRSDLKSLLPRELVLGGVDLMAEPLVWAPRAKGMLLPPLPGSQGSTPGTVSPAGSSPGFSLQEHLQRAHTDPGAPPPPFAPASGMMGRTMSTSVPAQAYSGTASPESSCGGSDAGVGWGHAPPPGHQRGSLTGGSLDLDDVEAALEGILRKEEQQASNGGGAGSGAAEGGGANGGARKLVRRRSMGSLAGAAELVHLSELELHRGGEEEEDHEHEPGCDPYGVFKAHPCPDAGKYIHMLEVTELPAEADAPPQTLSRFSALVAQLEAVDPGKLSQDELVAFWVNIYNALLMHAHLLHGAPTSHMRRISLMAKANFVIGHHHVSALVIEYIILRAHSHKPSSAMLLPIHKFKHGDERHRWVLAKAEPDVTFALVAGAWSSPALRVYSAANVRAELSEARKEYLQAAVSISASRKIIVPKLLDWYGRDFAKEGNALLDWIARQLPDEQRHALDEVLHEGEKVYTFRCMTIAPFEWDFRYIISHGV